MKVRERVLERLQLAGRVCQESIAQVREMLSLPDYTNKEVRRAIEALYYGTGQVSLVRFIVDEHQPRGWDVALTHVDLPGGVELA